MRWILSQENRTWSLMDLPLRKKHISMWWDSTIKFAFDGKPNKLKLTEKKYE